MNKKILLVLIYFFGVFGGFMFGYDIGIINGVLFGIKMMWNINLWLEGLIILGLFVGVMVGVLLMVILVDCFGCCKMIMWSVIVFVIGVLGLGIFGSISFLIVLCIILGVVVGGVFVLVLMYMGEISLVEICGKLFGLN